MSEKYKVIERGSRGATYRHDMDTWTVYEIGKHPRSSVLAGQQSRTFLDNFDSLEAAKAAYPDATESGSTYREPYLNHLPDDDGDPGDLNERDW